MKRQTLAFCAFAMLVLLLAVALTPADVFTGGRLVDTDAYMRLVRIRLLVESGAWFDATIPRSNWPFGETLHWTRPMDLVLLAGAAPFWPFVGFESALHLAGVFVPPLLLIATFAVVAWAADPVAGGPNRGFVLLVLLAQLVVVSYAQPGRPDHHALILLCFAVSLGFALRGLVEPEAMRWARGLGVACALGLWVSPEFLLPLGLFLGATMAAWVRRGDVVVRFNVVWTRTLTAALLVFLVAERGAAVAAIEYDKISAVHVAVALLAAGVWTVVSALASRGRPRSSSGRVVLGGSVGAASLVLMALIFPRFYGGPMVDVTDPVVRTWLHRVAELQPVMLPDDAKGIGLLVLYGGTALIAIPFLGAGMRRRDAAWDARCLLLVGIVGVLALSLAQLRWVTYVQIMSAIAVGALLARSRDVLRHELGTDVIGLLARAAVAAFLIAGPVLTGAVISSRANGVSGAARSAGAGARCEPDAVAAFLSSDPTWSRQPHTVAAHTDLGPALLYRSRHRVLATPYHRNEAGIRSVYDLFAADDADVARSQVQDRGVDLIALCPDRDGGLVPERIDGRPTLFGRLLADDPPWWLERVQLPEEVGSARLYRVAPPPTSTASLGPSD